MEPKQLPKLLIYNKIIVRVDGLARTDDFLLPAEARILVLFSRLCADLQCVMNENRVAFLGVQRTPSFIDQGQVGRVRATFKPERQIVVVSDTAIAKRFEAVRHGGLL